VARLQACRFVAGNHHRSRHGAPRWWLWYEPFDVSDLELDDEEGDDLERADFDEADDERSDDHVAPAERLDRG